MTGTFVPTYQGLSAIDLVRPARAERPVCFPFDAPERIAFYRARNAIYHLFRALVSRHPALTALVPDYNSGNEILAMRAAGARLRYYPVDRHMQVDPEEVEGLARRHGADLLYVIHYAGWAQPMPALADLCQRRGMLLVEDCALSLLSELDGRPLGSFGDWSVFCLYKTLPLPNGALLVQNHAPLPELGRLRLREAGPASVVGRTAELLVQRLRGRASASGAALLALKRAAGRAAAALDVRRANVGDIGFNLDEVDLAMSAVSTRLLDRIDCLEVRRARIANYRRLDAQLDPAVARVFPRVPEGVCPLFFPILVREKAAATRVLRRHGIDALEFWNESVDSGQEMGADARFLRHHVLELPIHQDLTPRHLRYMAEQVSVVCTGEDAPCPVSSVPDRVACRVERLLDEQALARLQPEWNELLSASAAANPFLTWEWLHAWWGNLHGTGALRILAVRAGHELIAVAPLTLRCAPRVWPSRLEFLGTGDAGSDYLDVIVRRGREAEALDAIADVLASERRPVRLVHLPEASASAQLADHLRRRGWSALLLPGGLCPVIPLADHTWESYLAALGPTHRANVRRRMRAIERQFRLRFDRVRTDAERDDALAALTRFHERRFRPRGGSTAFRTPALAAFHDAATRSALDRGWLRMYVLRLDDETAAVMYGLYYDGRFYFYQHGFDDRYERQSIGLVLMALTIRAALHEGAHTFDMLWGAEPYKWLWAREATTLRQIHLFPGDLGGRVQHGAVAARRTLARLARRVLTRFAHQRVARVRRGEPGSGETRAT